MDKINIDILAPNNKFSDSGQLDVFSLVQKNKPEDNPKIFLNNILKHKNKTRLKLIDVYNKILTSCTRQILEENQKGQHDMLFKVPLALFECPEYNPLSCIEFIEPKLRQLHLDTCSYLNGNIPKERFNDIFISWEYLELNMVKKA